MDKNDRTRSSNCLDLQVDVSPAVIVLGKVVILLL